MLDKRCNNEYSAARQCGNEERERHGEERDDQARVGCARRTLTVRGRHPSRPAGSWAIAGELVSEVTGDYKVTNDEGVESDDDEERDERVECGVDPRPDIGDQRLVTLHSSAVGHVGTWYLQLRHKQRQLMNTLISP